MKKILCLVFFGCLVWTAVGGVQEAKAQSVFDISLDAPSFEHRLRPTFGVMHQATSIIYVPFFSFIIGLPYAGLSLVPLIGNAIVMKSRSPRLLRGWGIAGIVMGSIGLVYGTFTSVMDLGAGFPEFWAMASLPLLAISVVNVILGAINVWKANQLTRPMTWSLAPYFLPGPNNSFKTGVSLQLTM